ncbi:hypothetical protein [Hymenobacter convexus]|uniref:hypothetical protein n=1 Tax=Hymenobacter sp. CA1UV-4 TaxID=3063782 RepID=UPI0027143300|nr:hypothetical protein [Hymenobacter sp. CA1UV-4]MDO7852306.1 hypothetical protein [Hymenobacter sp. CA1UV-4]
MSQEVEFASQAFPANQRQLALDWLKFTVEKWGQNLTKQKIGSSQELRRSLRGWLAEQAGGDMMRLRLAYAVQGVFVELGVGRGMGAGVRKETAEFRRLRNESGKLHRHVRKQKKWRTKQLAREQHRLGELMSELTGRTLVAAIASNTQVVTEVQINL